MISTWRMSEEGLRLGNQILQENDNLGEAIVRAVKCVEDDPAYVSVGYGGLPNREDRWNWMLHIWMETRWVREL